MSVQDARIVTGSGAARNVGSLYNLHHALISVNHRKARISAIGTVWHGACISIRVHTLPRYRGGLALFLVAPSAPNIFREADSPKGK